MNRGGVFTLSQMPPLHFFVSGVQSWVRSRRRVFPAVGPPTHTHTEHTSLFSLSSSRKRRPPGRMYGCIWPVRHRTLTSRSLMIYCRLPTGVLERASIFPQTSAHSRIIKATRKDEGEPEHQSKPKKDESNIMCQCSYLVFIQV